MQFNKYFSDDSSSNNLATAANNNSLVFRNERLDDPEGYIENVLGFSSMNDWNESKTVFCFKMGLREEARDWVSAISAALTLDELLRQFRMRFVGRTTCLTYIKKMANNAYAGGSIMNYLDKMKGWSKRAGLPDEVLVALVLNGLPETLANSLLLNSRGCLGWDFVYSSCEGVEIKGNMKEIGTEYNVVNKIGNRGKQVKNGACYRCGKFGHFSRNCRAKKNTTAEIQRTSMINEDNNDKMNEKDSINNEFIYSLCFENTKCPVFNIKVKNYSCKCLLDTGSTVNIIHPRLIDISKIQKKKIYLKTANGKYMKTMGVTKTGIEVDNKKIETNFIVSPEISIEVILGVPFFRDNKISIHYNDSKWELSFSDKVNKKNSSIGMHYIRTKTTEPVVSGLYRLGNKHEAAASEIITKYLKEGIIRKSTSPWRSPIVMVNKKNGGMRLCIDYRRLNNVTIKDSYPMPRTDEFFDQLADASFFTKLDAESGYHQIEMNPSDIEKTAFGCREGLFEFVKMPFGLVNGPATFQRVMNNILSDYIRKFVVVSMDDILIYSKSR